MQGSVDYRDARHKFPKWARNAEQRARCILDSIRAAREDALALVESGDRTGLQPMVLLPQTMREVARLSGGRGVPLPLGYGLTIVAMPPAVAGLVATRVGAGGPPRTGARVGARRPSLHAPGMVDLEIWVFALTPAAPPPAAPAAPTEAPVLPGPGFDVAAAMREAAAETGPIPPEVRARMDADRAAAEARLDAARADAYVDLAAPAPPLPDPAPDADGGDRG